MPDITDSGTQRPQTRTLESLASDFAPKPAIRTVQALIFALRSCGAPTHVSAHYAPDIQTYSCRVFNSEDVVMRTENIAMIGGRLHLDIRARREPKGIRGHRGVRQETDEHAAKVSGGHCAAAGLQSGFAIRCVLIRIHSPVL